MKLAARQHGVVSLAQAQDLGVSSKVVRHRCRIGMWDRLSSQVVSVPVPGDRRKRQLKAAELDVAGAAVTGRPALWLHGLRDVRWGKPRVVTVASGFHRSGLGSVRRSIRFTTEVVDEIRVTPLPQALMHAARHASANELGRWADESVAMRLATFGQIEDCLVWLAPLRFDGINRVREMLEHRTTGFVPPESELEAQTVELLRSHGFPPFECQARFPWRPEGRQRVDILIPRWKLIIECDGRLWHDRLAQAEADRQRDLEAAAHGYLVVRVSWHMVVHEPSTTISQIYAAGMARA